MHGNRWEVPAACNVDKDHKGKYNLKASIIHDLPVSLLLGHDWPGLQVYWFNKEEHAWRTHYDMDNEAEGKG